MLSKSDHECESEMNEATLQHRFAVSRPFATLVVARARQLNALGVAIDPENQVYYYEQKLGAGSFGATYSARRNNEQNVSVVIKEFHSEKPLQTKKDAPATPERRGLARLLLRLFSPTVRELPRDGYAFTKKEVETEFAATQYVRQKLGEDFCSKFVICALSYFYDNVGETGFIVFPYAANSVSLSVYLIETLHPKIRAALLGDGSFTKVCSEAYGIVSDIISAFQVLLRAGVIHQDIKPSNMLVIDGHVKLIDFGGACILYTRGTFTECESYYFGSWDFQDPMVLHTDTSKNSEEEQIDIYKKFETYAVAKVIQVVLDPAIVMTKDDDYEDSIIIRETPLITRDLHQLLVDMTDENNFARFPRLLTKAEQLEKLELLPTRPSMDQVKLRFQSITKLQIERLATAESLQSASKFSRLNLHVQSSIKPTCSAKNSSTTRADFLQGLKTAVAKQTDVQTETLSEAELFNLFDSLKKSTRIEILKQFAATDLDQYLFMTNDKYRRTYNGDMVLVDKIRDLDVVYELWQAFLERDFGVSYDPEHCKGDTNTERQTIANTMAVVLPTTDCLNAYRAAVFRRLYWAFVSSATDVCKTIKNVAQ